MRPLPSACDICGSTDVIHSSFGALCSAHYEEAKERIKAEYTGQSERYSDKPICPYCGHEYGDAWELDLKDNEEDEVECGRCETTFRVQCHISIDYSTRRTEVSAS